MASDLYENKQQSSYIININTVQNNRVSTENASFNNNRDSSTFMSNDTEQSKALKWFSIALGAIGLTLILYSSLWIVQNKKETAINSYISQGIAIYYYCTINYTPPVALLLIGAFMIMQCASGIRASMISSHKFANIHRRRFQSLLMILILLVIIRSFSLTKSSIAEGKKVASIINTLPFISQDEVYNSTHIHYIFDSLVIPNNYSLSIKADSPSLDFIILENQTTLMKIHIYPKEVPNQKAYPIKSYDELLEVHVVLDIVRIARLIPNKKFFSAMTDIIICIVVGLLLSKIAISINDSFVDSLPMQPLINDSKIGTKEANPYAMQN